MKRTRAQIARAKRDREILRLVDAGELTRKQIAEAVGVSTQTVWLVCTREFIPPLTDRKPFDKELARKLWSQGHNATSIAKQVGRAGPTVCQWLREQGLSKNGTRQRPPSTFRNEVIALRKSGMYSVPEIALKLGAPYNKVQAVLQVEKRRALREKEKSD